MITLKRIMFLSRKRWMEGEGEGEGAGAGGAGSGEGGGTGTAWDGKFTPEQQKAIDEKFNKRFAKEKSEKETLLASMKQLESAKGLTETERAELASKVEELETSMLTKEEQATRERTKLTDKHKKDLEGLTSERDTWKNRFRSSTIERALTDAALESGATSAEQIRMMFGGLTDLVEVKNDKGEVTGFEPTLTFTGLGEDGKTKEKLSLPVSAALKKIKEDGFNANLFTHTQTPGTGEAGNGGAGKSGSNSKMPTPDQFNGDMVAYQKAYNDYRDKYNLDGSPRKKG